MKQKILLIIAACLIFNNFAAMGNVEAAVNTSSPSVQSSAFQLVSFARVPFAIMSGVVEGIPFFPEYRQPAKKQSQSNNSQDNWYLFFIDRNTGLKGVPQTNNPEKAVTTVARATVCDAGMTGVKLFSDRTGLFCLFLLAYLVILSRSNLPWEITDRLFRTARPC